MLLSVIKHMFIAAQLSWTEFLRWLDEIVVLTLPGSVKRASVLCLYEVDSLLCLIQVASNSSYSICLFLFGQIHLPWHFSVFHVMAWIHVSEAYNVPLCVASCLCTLGSTSLGLFRECCYDHRYTSTPKSGLSLWLFSVFLEYAC